MLTCADIHLFTVGPRTFCLDVNSTVVFEIDDSACEMLRRATRDSRSSKQDFDCFKSDVFACLEHYRHAGFFAGNTKCARVSELAARAIPDLLGMSLLVADSCNLRCSYCFNDGGTAAREGAQGMTTEVARRAVQFLLDHSTGEVGLDFFGGEPLLSRELISEVIAFAEASGRPFQYSMITNGTLLDPGIVDLLVSNRFHVVVSYDGPVQDLHRPPRNGGSCRELVRSNVRELARRLPQGELSIRCVFTRGFEDLAELAREAEELGVRAVFGPATLPQGHVLAPGAEDLERLVTFEETYLIDAVHREDVDALCRVGAVSNTVLRLMTGEPRFYSCGVGKDILGVSATGDLYPCHRFIGHPDARLGNIDTGLDPEAFRRFASHHVEGRPACKACWARYLCGGGCAHDALVCGGDFWGVSESRCRFTRAELDVGLKLYVMAMEEHPDVLPELAQRAHLVAARPFERLRAEREAP